MDGWVKLYRKLVEHGLMRDHTALAIFISILLRVDRSTGKVKSHGANTHETLGLDRSTYYKALKRLTKKHKMVDITGDNRNKEIRLVNWHKYNTAASTVPHSVPQKNENRSTLPLPYIYKNKEEKDISKDISHAKRDAEVDLILNEFVKIAGREPADKKPRNVAYLLKRQTLKLIREIEPYKRLVFADVIRISFEGWIAKYPGMEIKHLDTIRRDLVTGIYELTRKKYIPDYKLPSERHDK